MGDCILDACVVRGAGNSQAIESKRCRETIDAIKNHRHILLVDSTLWGEWRRHTTIYSSAWLTEIVSRGQIQAIELKPNHQQEITLAIEKLPAQQRPVATKDIHILHAAIQSNALVISSEQSCRTAYVVCGVHYPPIQGIYWVSPLSCETLPVWLASNSQPQLDWLLINH